jgi:two-component system, OmpR family, sensor histidine kinase BaeS
MRRSPRLRLRLLGCSLAVTSVAVCATAALLSSSGPPADSGEEIRSALLAYANEHRSWAGVDALVRGLAERTGQRIALTTPDGRPIADSAEPAGQEEEPGLPTAPAVRIDAASARPGDFQPEPNLVATSTDTSLTYYQWQLTEAEREQRQALAEEAASCLREYAEKTGPEERDRERRIHRATLPIAAAGAAKSGGAKPTQRLPGAQECVPSELEAPTAAARALAAQTVERATDCLDERGLAYDVGKGANGLPVIEADPATRGSTDWRACQAAAEVAAKRSYVAEPADLYLGSLGGGWGRTGVVVGGVLLAAAALTVLGGRRVLAAGTAGTAGTAGGRPVLLGEVAHELRTPLANVRSQLEAAQDGVLPLDGKLVRTLIGESTLLERLVADLEDLALADARRLRVHPEEVDAGDLAAQAVAAHQARAQAGGVELRVAIAGTMPVYADPARIRQALSNLVSNALRHTPEGGLVEITVRREPDAVVLAVADTGSGIAPAHVPRVFERFYRAGSRPGGAGLGLAIAKQLVEAHGGTLGVTSVPGQGSTFTIWLAVPEDLGAQPGLQPRRSSKIFTREQR